MFSVFFVKGIGFVFQMNVNEFLLSFYCKSLFVVPYSSQNPKLGFRAQLSLIYKLWFVMQSFYDDIHVEYI